MILVRKNFLSIALLLQSEINHTFPRLTCTLGIKDCLGKYKVCPVAFPHEF